MGMSLRIELFVEDLDVFVDFYTRVLAFGVADDRRDTEWPYVAVARDGVRIGAVRAGEGVERAARMVPTGTEIVLEVDDVAAEHDRAVAAGCPPVGGLQRRPWGLTDFRLHDPDGYYLRVTGH